MNTLPTRDMSNPNNTTEVTEVPLTSLPLYRLGVSLWTFCYPVILLLGTFGNIMSMVIMRRMMSGESTINLFFIALAVGDLLVLYTGIVIKWINIAFGVNVIDDWPAMYYPFLCMYLSSGSFVSWTLVCMTIQRALSVAWPHHVNRIFTRRRVVNIIIGVTVFQMALYAHHLYCIHVTATTNITGSQCIGMESFSYVWFLDNVFVHIVMVLTSVLPFICLVVGNGVLASNLLRSMRQARKNIASGNLKLTLKRKRDTNSVTITIIVVSLAFIVLTLPVFIYAGLYRFKDQSELSTQRKAEIFLLYTVGSLMISTNSAMNFYVYCLTGRKFREEFIKILSCKATPNDIVHKT